MNKLSFFALSPIFVAQIALSENIENKPHNPYKYLSRLNNELSQNCSTAPKGLFLLNERDKGCGWLDKFLEKKEGVTPIGDPSFTEDQEDEIVKMIRAILPGETSEIRIKNYHEYHALAEQLDDEKWEKLIKEDEKNPNKHWTMDWKNLEKKRKRFVSKEEKQKRLEELAKP